MMGAKQPNGGMPAGLAMLIKTFMPGFDPTIFERKIGELQTRAQDTVNRFDSRLAALEKQNAEILDLLRKQQPMNISDVIRDYVKTE